MDLELTIQLKRVLTSLERLLPRPVPLVDWAQTMAAVWRRQAMNGYLEPVQDGVVMKLTDLLGIEGQKNLVVENTRQFLAGFPANNVLLWGTRGTGKSSLIRAILQEYSGEGLRIVQEGIDWLRRQGARTIGLETMPRTVENIGFYSALGFRPGHLTVTLVRDLERRAKPEGGRLSTSPDRARALAACTALTGRLSPGVDFAREQELTERYLLGDTTLLEREGELRGFALWHSAALADGRAAEELRVLKCVAIDHAA